MVRCARTLRPVVISLAFACSLILLRSSATAAELPAAELSLNKVVLFTSGVGFYEHKGDIEGDRRVEMRFNVDDINDLLKSMVLQDLGGGRISTVSYGSKDPVTKSLKTFAIDLTREPTLADLLRQIRGEKVQVDLGAAKITGTIVGIERRPMKVGADQWIDQNMLNLFTTTGLRSVPMEQIVETVLIDPKLNAELQQALAIVAAAHATDKKSVTLNFLGKGKRPVRVGYIQESPIWKTSYRLVLKDKDAPFLQGWAIVENTTEQDWNDVNLTLVSGRPISFIMDLYQPLYVGRPLVTPELYASLQSRTYGQDLAQREEQFRARQAIEGPGMSGFHGLGGGMSAGGFGGLGGRMGGGMGGGGGNFGAGIEGRASPESPKTPPLDLTKGVESAAATETVGELFRYVIDSPVTLARQQSAMLPIVNESIKGEKVSIYNAEVHAKHPLNGLKFTNSTNLHLMQGPITVFDGGEYAGDARVEDLAPTTERLISYALDLDTEVAPVGTTLPEVLVSVRIAKGNVHTTYKQVRTHRYVVKNSGEKAKKVLIEQSVDTAWKLVAPKEPTEKTRDLYRFAVQAEPGKPAPLLIEEEQTIARDVVISNLDQETILLYSRSAAVFPAVNAALAEITKRKQAIEAVTGALRQTTEEMRAIETEQVRIRENMTRLDRTAALYQRYSKKLNEQEDQIEFLRTQIAEKTPEEIRLRKSLDEYMLSLDL